MKRAIVMLAILLACPSPEADATSATHAVLDVSRYVASLENIHRFLDASDFANARAEALTLKAHDIVWAGGRFHADESLLDDVANATRRDPQLLGRIALTIDEIRRAVPQPGSAANQKLLQEVAKAQEVPELEAGGEVPTEMKADVPFVERIVNAILDALRWLGEKIEKFFKWLLDFLPRRSPRLPSATAGMRWIVITVVILIVVVVVALAIEVVRRARRGIPEPVEASAPLGSKRDEDPLSRGATEWERYAAQLAAAGRHREAIRAWYHAVLVTCYAGGVLYFRKGRTNWEYISALAPSVAWRPEFIELTRRFEQEWYGSLHSTAEALEECAGRARRILDALRRTAKGAA